MCDRLRSEGTRAYLTDGGAEGTLSELDVKDGTGSRQRRRSAGTRADLRLPRTGSSRWSRSTAVPRVVLVALDRLRVVDRIKTLAFPRDIAISPNGKRAFVTHNGFGAHQVTVIDIHKRREVRRSAVGPAPSGIAFNASGSRALVASQ